MKLNDNLYRANRVKQGTRSNTSIQVSISQTNFE